MLIFEGPADVVEEAVRSGEWRSLASTSDLVSAAIRRFERAYMRRFKPGVELDDAVAKALEEGLPLIRLVLAEGMDPNSPPVSDLPPLHVAASLPTASVFEMLVGAGGDLNAKDRAGRTVLQSFSSDEVRAWLHERERPGLDA